MRHAPHYRTGILELPEAGFYGGWTTHANAYSDCLPIWNRSRNICVLFSGEHVGDTQAPADVTAADLADRYETLGPGFFESLNGTFHGIVIDLRSGEITVFNDRFGLARLYCHETAEVVYFASEAKALLRILPALRVLDEDALGEQVAAGCTLRSQSLFKGISIVPAASAWTFRGASLLGRRTYFSVDPWAAQPALDAEPYYHELKSTFTRILPRYFRGDASIALSVTGGLDSRMILAGLAGQPIRLPCYTFGGMYRECEDVKLGRLIAELSGQTHSTIRIDETFLDRYLDEARRSVFVTDGCMDASGASGIFAVRQARTFGEIRMTGNYGSEILRQNVAFRASDGLAYAFAPGFRSKILAGVDRYREERNRMSALEFICKRQVPWHHYNRFALENAEVAHRSPYLDNDLVRLAFQAPPGLLLNKQLAYRYTRDLQPKFAGAPTDRGLYTKPPLVPRKLFELGKEVTPRLEYHFDYGMPHWLANVDRVLAPLHLERYFLGHQKFDHYRYWFRHQLAGTVRDILLDPISLARPHIDPPLLRKIVTDHTSGRANHTLAIHRLLSIELLYRELLESPAIRA